MALGLSKCCAPGGVTAVLPHCTAVVQDCREFFDAGGAKTISIAVETLRGLQEKLLPLVRLLGVRR